MCGAYCVCMQAPKWLSMAQTESMLPVESARLALRLSTKKTSSTMDEDCVITDAFDCGRVTGGARAIATLLRIRASSSAIYSHASMCISLLTPLSLTSRSASAVSTVSTLSAGRPGRKRKRLLVRYALHSISMFSSSKQESRIFPKTSREFYFEQGWASKLTLVLQSTPCLQICLDVTS